MIILYTILQTFGKVAYYNPNFYSQLYCSIVRMNVVLLSFYCWWLTSELYSHRKEIEICLVFCRLFCLLQFLTTLRNHPNSKSLKRKKSRGVKLRLQNISFKPELGTYDPATLQYIFPPWRFCYRYIIKTFPSKPPSKHSVEHLNHTTGECTHSTQLRYYTEASW